MNIGTYITEVFSFISGAVVGSFLTIKVRDRISAQNNSRIVNQSGASSQGDMVGRDKNEVGGDYVKGNKSEPNRRR